MYDMWPGGLQLLQILQYQLGVDQFRSQVMGLRSHFSLESLAIHTSEQPAINWVLSHPLRGLPEWLTELSKHFSS